MNRYQELWWTQARSDHAIFQILRGLDLEPCHRLHYLQMVAEKLGKAYFWRSSQPGPKSHVSFVSFLRALDDRSGADRRRIASLLGFGQARDFRRWIATVGPLAHALESLAPALAGDGPNAEYPWPHAAPAYAPAVYQFAIWNDLDGSVRGKQLTNVIDAALATLPQYA